ncbi:MAG: hypothetical protein ACE5LU_17500 [Anaerolineae bacterium]
MENGTRQDNIHSPFSILPLPLVGAGMLACFAGMTRLTHFTRQGHTYLTLFFAAFALYLGAAVLILRRPTSVGASPLVTIAIFAILFRVPLWITTPTLSTDIWRYLWDGRLINHAINPYATPVDAPALDYLATPLRQRVDHAWMATPYPPAAELVFAGVYRLAPENPTAMQVTFTLFDLATAVVIVRLLRRLSIPDERVLIYAWNPLIVVEFAHSAHVDSLMTLFGMLAIYWLIAGRRTRSAIALAVATLTKFVPALVLPVFVRRWGVLRTLLYGALVGVAFVPFLSAGLGLDDGVQGIGIFGALRIYATRWKTNDGLFFWLVRTLNTQVTDPVPAAKLIALIVLALLGFAVLVRSTSREAHGASQTTIGYAALLLSGYLLLTPAMFPWYLTWLIALLPALPLCRSWAALAFTAGWLYFAAAVNLSYLFYLDPANPREHEWIRRTEYWPLFTLLAIAVALYGLRSRRYTMS